MTVSNGKAAIVTGASRGIGAAIARKLAADGFSVVVNYARGAGDAAALAAEIAADGGKAIAVQADVSDAASVRAMFATVSSELGGLDVLVNNAGIMHLSPIGDTKTETFETMVAVNLTGTFNTLREAARSIRPGGRIINFSSSVVGLALPGYGPYIATKAAIEGLTRVLANELRGRNVTVNAVAPGPTATSLFLDGKSPELIDRMAKMNPLERLGKPEDIADVVAFLAGPAGGWINGQVLRANGGMV